MSDLTFDLSPMYPLPKRLIQAEVMVTKILNLKNAKLAAIEDAS
jgi:hypothetical protein